MTHVALYPQDGLNLISLCTGGGGLDLGVELAIPSARAVCMVEREAFAVARLVSAMEAGLLAPAAVWSDARSLDGRRWRGIVDGVIGGIPCQPHSLAGKRLAGRDERDLWSAARRIIVQSRAWFVLIENVGGMLSSGGASGYGETFADWAIRLRQDYSRRLRSARAISANGSLSSLWMTPTAGTESSLRGGGQDPEARKAAGHQVNLKDQVVGFSKMWPTPTARDHRSIHASPASMQRNARPLSESVGQWPTPRASDGEKGGPNQAFGTGSLPLPALAAQWRTPRAKEDSQYQYDRGNKTKPSPTLLGQAFSHPVQVTSTPGEASCSDHRILNPRFVEWLMGWPRGWTSSECSETEWCHWSLLMRCALSSLGSPPAAPPAQLSLLA